VALFNLERVHEILESTPLQKNFLKDKINCYENGNAVKELYDYLSSVALLDVSSE
jgi:hypothetical protein